MMEIQFQLLHPARLPEGRIRAAVFDFDGTFSTLRCGWEEVMRPMMAEFIGGGKAGEGLLQKVDEYIDASTGIQTVYQMRWLAEQANATGNGRPERDEWWYKAEYNRRLMQRVEKRLERLAGGQEKPEQYLIAGAVEFLKAVRKQGIDVYLASGTDHKDVVREAGILGVKDLFTEIRGAPEHEAACSKEAVLAALLEEKRLSGAELLVVGDGKVEIALGAACGAFALGAATDENSLRGVNPVKRTRLIKAGADALVGDFTCKSEIFNWLGLSD